MAYSTQNLRRFNLVAFDLRSHGETGGNVPSTYSRIDAANDTANLMDALRLPPCHIVGNSMGADIALQLGIMYPQKIASLTLMSPLPDVEDSSVTDGRQEIIEYWELGYRNADDQACRDAVWGRLQLLYNNLNNSLSRSLLAITMPSARKNWGPGNFNDLETITVKYFTNDRVCRTTSDYARIPCPVLILYCTEDVAFSTAVSQKLEEDLNKAGVDVELVNIEGAPHFGPVSRSHPINKTIERFMASFCPGGAPPIPVITNSPWDFSLREQGLKTWCPDSDKSDDDDL